MPRNARFANFNPSVRALGPKRGQREYPNAAASAFSFCIQIHSNFEKIIDFSTSWHKSPQLFGIFALIDHQHQIIPADHEYIMLLLRCMTKESLPIFYRNDLCWKTLKSLLSRVGLQNSEGCTRNACFATRKTVKCSRLCWETRMILKLD